MKNNSKFLSLILRHKPETINIKLDKNGWVGVDELLEKCSLKDYHITKKELDEIVFSNDKQRFTFNEDKSKIRANQGHSINVDLDLKISIPPITLYHGTVEKFIKPILKEGLKPMNRNHVHLSDNLNTATNVGSRRGNPIILIVDSKSMLKDGYKFYKSKNNVWLTEEVPSKYIKIKE
jgi:putative RNA 2'-phosphotransferase